MVFLVVFVQAQFFTRLIRLEDHGIVYVRNNPHHIMKVTDHLGCIF